MADNVNTDAAARSVKRGNARMKLWAFGRVEGPCVSPSIKAYGGGDVVREYEAKLSDSCPVLDAIRKKLADKANRVEVVVRADFHLWGQRLRLSDLDNLAKTLLDGLFGKFGGKGIKPIDRHVHRLELTKVGVNKTKECTEWWIYRM